MKGAARQMLGLWEGPASPVTQGTRALSTRTYLPSLSAARPITTLTGARYGKALSLHGKKSQK